MKVDTYTVRVQRVVDGDTLALELDVPMPGGRVIVWRDTLRLSGIDANSNEADEAVRSFVADQRALTATVHRSRDKYGRLLGDVYGKDGVTLTSFLLDRGLAVRVNYSKHFVEDEEGAR